MLIGQNCQRSLYPHDLLILTITNTSVISPQFLALYISLSMSSLYPVAFIQWPLLYRLPKSLCYSSCSTPQPPQVSESTASNLLCPAVSMLHHRPRCSDSMFYARNQLLQVNGATEKDKPTRHPPRMRPARPALRQPRCHADPMRQKGTLFRHL